MSIVFLTIPDDPEQWAEWLEQQLTGIRLRDLVEELKRIPNSGKRHLSELISPADLSSVCSHGLRVLSVDQIRDLFGSPGSLLELQATILVRGGEYWQSLPEDSQITAATARVRERLREVNLLAESPDDEPPKPQKWSLSQPGSGRRLMFWLAGVAAAVLIAFFGRVFDRSPGPGGQSLAGSGHILGAPGLLVNDVASSDEYLRRLADAGESWFSEHPPDTAALIAVLEDVSRDCQVLIDAEHQALSTADRVWFVERCAAWKKEFDSTITSLRSGTITFAEGRDRGDRAMKKLVNALRDRAAA